MGKRVPSTKPQHVETEKVEEEEDTSACCHVLWMGVYAPIRGISTWSATYSLESVSLYQRNTPF